MDYGCTAGNVSPGVLLWVVCLQPPSCVNLGPVSNFSGVLEGQNCSFLCPCPVVKPVQGFPAPQPSAFPTEHLGGVQCGQHNFLPSAFPPEGLGFCSLNVPTVMLFWGTNNPVKYPGQCLVLDSLLAPTLLCWAPMICSTDCVCLVNYLFSSIPPLFPFFPEKVTAERLL